MQKIKPVAILEATLPQLQAFAINFLGLDATEVGATEENKLISTIMAANGGSENIFVAEEPATETPQGDAPPAPADAPVHNPGLLGTLGHGDPKVKVRINNETRNNETYTRDVEVGVNGRCWLIKRNMDVLIPMRVYEALMNAVQTNIDHQNVGSDVIENETTAPRVTVQVLEMPSRDEIAAWHARTDDLEMA